MKRSIGALLAGFITVVVLSIASDMLMQAVGLLPKLMEQAADLSLAIAATYRTLYGALGSFIVARLAPDRPMKHALISGVVGFLLSIIGLVVTWNAGPAFEPKWYPITLVVTALPSAWVGGKIFLLAKGER